MIFTRYLISLLVVAGLAIAIPLRKHHSRHHGKSRNYRQAAKYDVVSRTLNDGTRHDTIREYGDELPALPVPRDYDMTSMEENDGSILVPVDKDGKVLPDYMRRIQPTVVFMTMEDILRLNGTGRAERPPPPPLHNSETPVPPLPPLPVPENIDDTPDYVDSDVLKLPKTIDYTSSKETDPDLQKATDYESQKGESVQDVVDAIEEAKKELLEEIEEERLSEKEKKAEQSAERLEDDLAEKIRQIERQDEIERKEDIEEEEKIIEQEEKTLIEKVKEEIDDEIIDAEVKRKQHEKHDHNGNVQVETATGNDRSEPKINGAALFEPRPTEIVKTLQTDDSEETDETVRDHLKNSNGKIKVLTSGKSLKPSSSCSFNIITTLLVTLSVLFHLNH